MTIILASGSPRRRELLERASVDCHIMAVDIDETRFDGESPTAYIERMVAAKADAAIAQLRTQPMSDAATDGDLLLTADTIGVMPDGHTVLTKPVDREHAYRMWQQMSDNTHDVWTCVQLTQIAPHTLASPQTTPYEGPHDQGNDLSIQRIIERTEVSFVPLTPAMMRQYWDSGEPIDKAGGYGIQGRAAAWVSRINGSYTNVVGLPLAQTLALIETFRRQD